MKRRNFIILTTASAATIAIPSWYYKYGHMDNNQLLTEPELLSYIWDDTTINEIGKIYREQYSNENSEQKLTELLLQNNSIEMDNFIEFLQQQIKGDFETENTVILDGWILSLSEARQCALFSLTH